MPFTWTASVTLAVASEHCANCEGTGMRYIPSRNPERPGRRRPCRCALRGIFRTCYARWRYIQTVSVDRMSQIQYGIREQASAQAGFSMPDMEYSADFTLLARRHLDAQDLQIFRFHHEAGADWRYCCKRLQIDRGAFFHAVYRIEEKLGRACAETQPYPLFPLDRYFAGVRYRPDTSLPAEAAVAA